ncbi:hypothetical protein [Rhodopseudomonas pseudopalustris]|uniref:hypothetical protein n=1 Tax=Rhodopseudomonas pseudopalustris TaxID=1513892 RepID=UPI001113BC39|nr:hypothetical protein [Rhodopseudomonas pseudopalustris]
MACVNSNSVFEAAPAKRAAVKTARLAPSVPWRERELLQLKLASEVSGRSIAGLYADAKAGKLKFRDFGGRTLVETKSLIALMAAAPDWTPRDRGKEARAARKQIAAAALRS